MTGPTKQNVTRQYQPSVKLSRVLVKTLAAKDKTPGGLFIPDTVKKKLFEALVISVGNGKLLKRVEIRVLIGKYSGSEVTLDGEDHIALREDDIHGNLEK